MNKTVMSWTRSQSQGLNARPQTPKARLTEGLERPSRLEGLNASRLRP